MFGKKQIASLESELSQAKKELENTLKEKTDLSRQLEDSRRKIDELEKLVRESELTELKDKAKQTIVEYEGLKEHYIRKAKEIEDTRAEVEEGFAKEAAVKRHDLAEEIRTNKESNQAMISETVQTFTGSYMYYLDQIRVLMDALSRAAKETGDTLFDGDTANIKGRFGDRIAEYLQSDANTLEQNSGDLLLIGAEENPETEAEESGEAFPEEEKPAEGFFWNAGETAEEEPEEEPEEEAPEEEASEETAPEEEASEEAVPEETVPEEAEESDTLFAAQVPETAETEPDVLFTGEPEEQEDTEEKDE